MAHALTYRSDFVREHRMVLSLSVLAHLALLVVLSANLNLFPRRETQPTRLAIQATVVDERVARARTLENERREREARLAAERRREEVLEQDRRRQEQQRLEQERVQAEQRAAEQKRQAQLEAERRETRRREQEAEKARQAQAEQQRREAQARKLAAAETERKAAAARKQAQVQADLARQMAEEEEYLAAADSGLLDQYAEIIRQKVERNWTRPASAREGIACVVLVKQIPGGDVVDVQVAECNGDAAVVRSIEVAVRRSSPLPPPPDPSLFERSLRFEFRPRD
jgi:colicin import membrane protein